MTNAIAKTDDVRIPVTVAELNVDRCRFEYGKSYTNLFAHSENFSDSYWTKSGITITADTIIAPDGTLTADSSIENTSFGLHRTIYKGAILLDQTQIYTLSFYIKPNGRTSFQALVFANITTNFYTVIVRDMEIYNDSYGGNGVVIDSQLENVGNGWYRCSVTGIADTTASTTPANMQMQVRSMDDAYTINYTGDGVSGFYIWGAQLVQGNKPGHYVKTTTASVSAGCSAVNAKANLLLWSEDFTNAVWNIVGTGSRTANAALDPNGQLTADRINDTDTAVDRTYVDQYVTVPNDSNTYCLSLYLKKDTSAKSRIALYFVGGTTSAKGIDIDWTTPSAPAATDGKLEYITDGWYRLSVILANNNSGNTTAVCRVYPAGYDASLTGNCYVWGMQFVKGSIPGIYYKTTSAAFSGIVGTECYNCYKDCEVPADYLKIIRSIRFYNHVSNWPKGVKGYPCLNSRITFTPCMIDTKGSLGRRGVVDFSMFDFTDDDIDTDPYVKGRTYDPETQGTFFGKLKARDPYYKGRHIVMRQGYLQAAAFSWADFDERLYICDSFQRSPNRDITITGKDILKLADDKKALLPIVSTGTLSAAYTAGSSTTIVLQTGEGVDYTNDPYTGTAISGSVPGYVRVGDNVLQYTGVSTDTLTGVTGGWFGSTDANASVDDSVQQCLHFENVNVVDIIYYLLNTGAGIDARFLPYSGADEWDIEKANWLSGNDLTHTVTESTGIQTLLKQVCEQNLVYLWFNEKEQKVKLKAIAPAIKNETPVYLTDESNIIANTIETADNINAKISRVIVHYDQIDITKDNDKQSNYNRTKIQIDTDSENSNAEGEVAARVIYANWLTGANAGLIITLAGRLLARYSGTPSIAKFKIDSKDSSFWTGATAILDSFAFQDKTGAHKLQKMQIIKASEDHAKQLVYLEGETWDYLIYRYAFVAPNTLGDYLSETEANQNAYGYICDNAGYYTNGDLGHLIA